MTQRWGCIAAAGVVDGLAAALFVAVVVVVVVVIIIFDAVVPYLVLFEAVLTSRRRCQEYSVARLRWR